MPIFIGFCARTNTNTNFCARTNTNTRIYQSRVRFHLREPTAVGEWPPPHLPITIRKRVWSGPHMISICKHRGPLARSLLYLQAFILRYAGCGNSSSGYSNEVNCRGLFARRVHGAQVTVQRKGLRGWVWQRFVSSRGRHRKPRRGPKGCRSAHHSVETAPPSAACEGARQAAVRQLQGPLGALQDGRPCGAFRRL